MSGKKALRAKVDDRIEALSEAEAHYESIIEGGGQYSTHADQLSSTIASDGAIRAIIFVTGIIIGLVGDGEWIELSRFAWMGLVLIPIIYEVVTSATAQSWSIWIAMFLEIAAGLAPEVPLTLVLIFRTLSCAFQGTDCPTGDDTQLKRVVEILPDIMITLMTIRVCISLMQLGLGYRKAEREQERASDIEMQLQAKMS